MIRLKCLCKSKQSWGTKISHQAEKAIKAISSGASHDTIPILRNRRTGFRSDTMNGYVVYSYSSKGKRNLVVGAHAGCPVLTHEMKSHNEKLLIIERLRINQKSLIIKEKRVIEDLEYIEG